MARFTPETVAEHPAFRSLVAIGLEVASAQSAVNQGASRDERRAYSDRANALSVRVRSGKVTKVDEAAIELGELSGLSEADVRDLAARTRESAKAFLDAFPDIQSVDERTKTDVLTEAIKRDPAVEKAAGELAAARASADGGDSPETCKAVCLAFYLAVLAGAIALMIIGVAVCAAIGWTMPWLIVLSILCIIAVIGGTLALMAWLWGLYNDCVANCVDPPWGDE